MSFIAEYIWTGLNSTDIRSKVRVTDNIYDWNCDGSSCGHGTVDRSEYVLKPVMYIPGKNCIVLCDSESRRQLKNISWTNEPWFGLEQEYFIMQSPHISDSRHYCGQGLDPVERAIVQEHLELCLQLGLSIGGTNAEVAPHQWEFQIGPLGPMEACDQLIVARFLLMRVAENYGRTIEFGPKPFACENGSGCHINVSTAETRANPDSIVSLMPYLERDHDKFIRVCGEHNLARLTGTNETSTFKSFTWGIGTRNTSIRINDGYYEDRRPGADIDPYLAVASILQSIM